MPINIAVCDDDTLVLEELFNLLNLYKNEKLIFFKVSFFPNGFTLLDAVENGESFDIVILDILMPGGDGIETAKELRKCHQDTEIIFLTSSAEYAVKSYEVNANNYILKPITKEKLFPALDKCFVYMDKKQNMGFVIRSAPGHQIRIFHSELVYVEAMGKRVNIHIRDGGVITPSSKNLSGILELIGADTDFIRPHRSFIVNLNYVEMLTKKDLILENGIKIPISRNKHSEISQAFFDFSFSNTFDKEGKK